MLVCFVMSCLFFVALWSPAGKGQPLICKYLQSPLTITILLVEEKKMIGKLDISDRKDRNLKDFKLHFQPFRLDQTGYGSRPLAQGQTGIALSFIRSYLQFGP